ncbi:MAG: hypothetical protein J1F11_05755 [Oscillospiraceae bacterium]|nr:hypothetical protein [Oscillospiraceae bacterium]
MIPYEVLKNGSVTIYDDTADRQQLIKEIEEYNDEMWKCRDKMKKLDKVKYVLMTINLFCIACFFSRNSSELFADPTAAIAVLVINGAALLVFALYKSNFIVNTVTSALYLIINKLFLFPFAANVAVLLLHEYLERPLKAHTGYPIFADIRIRYEQGRHIKLDWDE